MQPTQDIIGSLYTEEVDAARRMSPEDKFLAGPRLFEYASRITIAGIRDQFPDATDEEVQRRFADRLALRERLDHQERRRYVEGLSRGN